MQVANQGSVLHTAAAAAGGASGSSSGGHILGMTAGVSSGLQIATEKVLPEKQVPARPPVVLSP